MRHPTRIRQLHGFFENEGQGNLEGPGAQDFIGGGKETGTGGGGSEKKDA